MKMLERIWVILLVVGSASSVAAETHRFDPELGYQTYKVREPVLRVQPGDIVETRTLFSPLFVQREGAWPGEVGPIYIEGATPEDTLVIKIVKLRPNIVSGRSGTSQGYAALTQTRNTPMLHEPVPDRVYLWRIDRENMTATLNLPRSRMRQVTVDLIPMLGRLATAPSGEQAISGGVPYDFGGNMDTSLAREGATVYLPIFHEGAYFYFGDVHALQGDGEITGTGIETSADVTFELDLIKGQKIAWPRLENEDFIMVAGSVRPLMDAFRIAHVEMVKWLEADYGFERWEAMQLLSQVGEAQIANVVDPNYTIVSKFPKRYLPRSSP